MCLNGVTFDRLSENALTRLALYYILTIYFWINNIWYTSVGSTSFSDSLFNLDSAEKPQSRFMIGIIISEYKRSIFLLIMKRVRKFFNLIFVIKVFSKE